MNQRAKVTVVLPVYNGRDRIEAEVLRVLEEITEFITEAVEVIVVDDASVDGTADIVHSLADAHPQVRVVTHPRRLGMEAAGQSGLERALGDLVFIQEEDAPLRVADLGHLYRMGSDPTVVAARAPSASGRTASRQPLLRRLRAWGARGCELLVRGEPEFAADLVAEPPGLQMVRRSQLRQLVAWRSRPPRLAAERVAVSLGENRGEE